ncbi:MAG: GNAT family N-acetyltransferase [Candidatus Baldrarchaeia archaeon]
MAEIRDLETLAKLYYDFYYELRDKQGCRAEDIEEIKSSVKSYISDPHNVIFLAFVNGDVAGFVRVSEREGCFWAEEIYVKPSYRRMGVGKSLMNNVEQHVLEKEGDAVYGMVLPQNKGALLFLRKLGYDILNTIELVKRLEPISESEIRIVEILGLKFKMWKWLKEEYDDLEKEYLQVIEEFFEKGETRNKLLQIIIKAIKDYLKKVNK